MDEKISLSFSGSVTIDEIDKHPSFIDKFFSQFILTNNKGTSCESNENHILFMHSNGICLIGLDKSHPAASKQIESIDFNIGNVNRSLNEVIGKSKKGGMILQENTTICRVICLDRTVYNIKSCIQGKLVEINKKLLSSPELLNQGNEGYIAVILPKAETIKKFRSTFEQNNF